MPRDLPVGNGSMLVAFDHNSILREFHFPHVGQENHTGQPFHFGVWVNGKFSWVPDGWEITRDYLDDTLVTNVELVHQELGVRIWVNDLVDFTRNLYLKKMTVENLSEEAKEIKLFLGHHFNMYGNEVGDTATYRPEEKGILHYKGDRYVFINMKANGQFGIDLFAVGDRSVWKDAEDGLLSGNPISQGCVGSVVEIPMTIGPKEKDSCFYWIASGKDWSEVKELDEDVIKKTPEEFMKRTINYWRCWGNKEELNFDLLPKKIARLHQRSLLICRTQMNSCGSIIAGNDSDVIQFNRDTYSYMWPRDASLIAHAMNLAGYDTPQFYEFLGKIIEKEGYFLHKYMPSGALGSSWHPWIKNDQPQLPIQEDETALVIWSLWQHYIRFRDLELIRPLYAKLVKKAADFMVSYTDQKTGLPLPSYDLWEERQGVLTFTTATVHGGLIAAANFAESFGDTDLVEKYRNAAQKMRVAMDRYLYLPDKKRFARMITFSSDGKYKIDDTIDASLYAIFAFGAYNVNDEKVKNTMEQILDKLKVAGGIIRYENDSFYKTNDQSNPWFICTLWSAQYFIAKAKTKDDLKDALGIMEWVADHALPSGVLAEQINPKTLEPMSVSPLTWSHGTFIATVQGYLNKILEIEVCPKCHTPTVSKRKRPNS